MIGSAIVLLLLSVWCLYIASGRIEYHPKGFIQKLADRPLFSRCCGALLAIVGAVILMVELGNMTGFIVGLISWATAASLLLLFAPFSRFKVVYLFILCLVVLVLEFVF
jgi:hypothetical protein